MQYLEFLDGFINIPLAHTNKKKIVLLHYISLLTYAKILISNFLTVYAD